MIFSAFFITASIIRFARSPTLLVFLKPSSLSSFLLPENQSGNFPPPPLTEKELPNGTAIP